MGKMSGKKTTITKSRYYLKGMEKIHPFKSIVLLFQLISIIILGFLIFNFEIRIAGEETHFSEIKFSDIFYISTLILFSTLFYSNRLHQFFKEEDLSRIKKNYYLLLLISSTFIVLQMVSVYMFQVDNKEIASESFSSYILLLISFHLVHLILSIVMIILLLFRLINTVEDPVKMLVYVTNPFEKLLIEIEQMTWNYQVALWLVIYLYILLRF